MFSTMYHTACHASGGRRRAVSCVAALFAFGALGATVLSAQVAGAQEATEGRSFDVRAVAGGFIATGDLRDDITDAGLYGGQLAWNFHRNWSAVGTFGWAPTGTRSFTPNRHVDAYQYDLSLEGRLPAVTAVSGVDVGLFLGTGFGGRSYSVRHDGGSDTQFDGFVSAGVEFTRSASPFVLRAEARDYLSSYEGVDGAFTSSKTRNDVGVFAGFGYRFR